jgi:putative phosphoesterase
MRVAVISDVHADIAALRDGLAQAARLGCERILCAGDLVGYGLFPAETIDLIREHDVTCVRGNHDRWATDPAMSGSSAGVLSDESLAYLTNLPRVWTGTLAGVRLALCHGTPKSDMDGVRPGAVSSDDVRRWLESAGADVLIVGHTHAPGLIEDIGGGMVINPGALAREGIHLPLVRFDSSGGAAGQKKTAPRGTFGILDLPAKRFTVHLAADGKEVHVATTKTGIADRRG